jgi:signal peptidase II
VIRSTAARALGVVIAAVVVSLDQVSKSWAVTHLQSGPRHLIGPLSLRLEYNPGFAFSLGTSYSSELAVVALVVSVFLLLGSLRTKSTLTRCALGLVAGGALGNLADRVFRSTGGAVVDFIYSGFWPTFNLADASIVIGAIALGISLLRQDRREHG